jgi:hypothetical protein
MICKVCGIDKEEKEFRNRKTCKECENKLRYQRKKEKLKNDPEYKKKEDRYSADRQKRRRKDPEYSKKEKIRCVVKRVFSLKKGYKKDMGTEKILGAPYDVVISHIESLFVDGMSWDNRELWHIDHIVPLCSAKGDEVELIKLSHYKNLQPLWVMDNLKKGGKIAV